MKPTAIAPVALVGMMIIGGGEPVRADDGWRLDASDWARPRSGATLVGMAPLPEVIRAWSATDGKNITILHAGGEEGELWARELRDWLVALGVPGDRVRLEIGRAGPASLRLELRESD